MLYAIARPSHMPAPRSLPFCLSGASGLSSGLQNYSKSSALQPISLPLFKMTATFSNGKWTKVAATRTLEAQLRALEGSTPRATPSSTPVLLAVNLMPGLTRSANDLPKITLAANTSLVRFSLPLLDDNFTAFRASLMNGDSREVWSQNKVSATITREGKTVVLTVPAEVLSNGDYSFNLMGVPDSGAPENIGRYYFRSVRQ